jgi:hypothetical protein
METDLSTRFDLYANAVDRQPHGKNHACADALSCWRAATAGHSAGIVCSHTRVLRGDGEDVLEKLLADQESKPAEAGTDQADTDAEKPRHHMPLYAGDNTAALLAQGAEGVIALKARNG